jgi:hypothetical protein
MSRRRIVSLAATVIIGSARIVTISNNASAYSSSGIAIWQPPVLGLVKCRERPNANDPPFRREFCRTAPACPQAGAVSLADRSPVPGSHFIGPTKRPCNKGGL